MLESRRDQTASDRVSFQHETEEFEFSPVGKETLEICEELFDFSFSDMGDKLRET